MPIPQIAVSGSVPDPDTNLSFFSYGVYSSSFSLCSFTGSCKKDYSASPFTLSCNGEDVALQYTVMDLSNRSGCSAL